MLTYRQQAEGLYYHMDLLYRGFNISSKISPSGRDGKSLYLWMVLGSGMYTTEYKVPVEICLHTRRF